MLPFLRTSDRYDWDAADQNTRLVGYCANMMNYDTLQFTSRPIVGTPDATVIVLTFASRSTSRALQDRYPVKHGVPLSQSAATSERNGF